MIIFATMFKKLSILNLTLALLMMLTATVVPHHHHDTMICIVEEICCEDGECDDEHTSHDKSHDAEDETHCVAHESYLLSHAPEISIESMPAEEVVIPDVEEKESFATSFSVEFPLLYEGYSPGSSGLRAPPAAC